jgi:hypothetical protein
MVIHPVMPANGVASIVLAEPVAVSSDVVLEPWRRRSPALKRECRATRQANHAQHTGAALRRGAMREWIDAQIEVGEYANASDYETSFVTVIRSAVEKRIGGKRLVVEAHWCTPTEAGSHTVIIDEASMLTEKCSRR